MLISVRIPTPNRFLSQDPKKMISAKVLTCNLENNPGVKIVVRLLCQGCLHGDESIFI